MFLSANQAAGGEYLYLFETIVYHLSSEINFNIDLHIFNKIFSQIKTSR